MLYDTQLGRTMTNYGMTTSNSVATLELTMAVILYSSLLFCVLYFNVKQLIVWGVFPSACLFILLVKIDDVTGAGLKSADWNQIKWIQCDRINIFDWTLLGFQMWEHNFRLQGQTRVLTCSFYVQSIVETHSCSLSWQDPLLVLYWFTGLNVFDRGCRATRSINTTPDMSGVRAGFQTDDTHKQHLSRAKHALSAFSNTSLALTDDTLYLATNFEPASPIHLFSFIEGK